MFTDSNARSILEIHPKCMLKPNHSKNISVETMLGKQSIYMFNSIWRKSREWVSDCRSNFFWIDYVEIRWIHNLYRAPRGFTVSFHWGESYIEEREIATHYDEDESVEKRANKIIKTYRGNPRASSLKNANQIESTHKKQSKMEYVSKKQSVVLLLTLWLSLDAHGRP